MINKSQIRSVTFLLITINIVVFLLQSVLDNDLLKQGKLYYFQHESFNYFQYITSSFIHGGLLHLAFNMLALWFLSKPLERKWGKLKFILFYFACGLGAGLFNHLTIFFQIYQAEELLFNLGVSKHWFNLMLQTGRDISVDLEKVSIGDIEPIYGLYQSAVVGASGAVYGLLVAYAVCFPDHKIYFLFIPYPVAAKYFVPILLLVDLCLGISDTSLFGVGIAHFSHIGGALVGFVLMLFFKKGIKRG